MDKAFDAQITEMENNPFKDILGTYYSEINSKVDRDNRGEFYTPPAVCSLMARMTVDVEKAVKDRVPLSILL